MAINTQGVWKKEELSPKISSFLASLEPSLSSLPEERLPALDRVVEKVKRKREMEKEKGEEGDIIWRFLFVCTHNSRRSHFCQVWAAAAAAYYEIEGVECYSAGTEATACNPRTIASLERSGFTITKSKETTQTNNPENNPTYLVSGNITNTNPLFCFSKTIDDSFNPKKNFVSIMTCSSADAGCPVVFGAFARIPVTFEDPKVADDTPEEEKIYDERGAQIALEMLYIFSKLK